MQRELGGPAQRAAPSEKTFSISTARGFRHAPNRELVIENHTWSPTIPLVYKTNSLGYRNPEVGPKQGKRYLFLGDSVTFGQGVNEEWTFVRLLENQARARAQGKNWEMINGAVEGLGTDGELAVLNETGLAIRPEAVVLGFYLNDHRESPGIFVRQLPGILNRSRMAHKLAQFFYARTALSSSEDTFTEGPRHKPPDEILSWKEDFRKNSTILPKNQKPDQTALDFNNLALKYFEDWGGAFSPHVWDKLQDLLEEFVRLSKENHFKFMIVNFPVRDQVESPTHFDYPQQRLARMARDLNVPYLDLLPLLRQEYQRVNRQGDRLFFDQCHLTPLGNQITAQAIYRFLNR